jgi:protein involved in polysaccharide export with SLBB domain
MKKMVPAFLLFLLVGGMPGPVPVAAQSLASETPVLLPGDIIRIDVWRRPELSGEFFIGADSAISHPFYQEVKVAHLPVSTAVFLVKSFLEESEENPRVRIEPMLRVAVGGEVRQPNLYSLSPETTVAQALALAGGPTERGRLDRVRVVRGGTEAWLDLTDPAAPLAQMPIRSGDQIMIDRRVPIFREYVLPTLGVVGTVASLVNMVLYRR